MALECAFLMTVCFLCQQIRTVNIPFYKQIEYLQRGIILACQFSTGVVIPVGTQPMKTFTLTIDTLILMETNNNISVYNFEASPRNAIKVEVVKNSQV